MANYAIEIGKVVLQSDRPITTEQREEAIRLLTKNRRILPTPEGEITAVPDGID